MRFLTFLVCILIFASCNSNSKTYVTVETEFGNMVVEVYDSTPKHKENFVKLVKADFYKDLLFHRVINGFMVQGGDPNSRGASMDTRLGSGGPGYKIDAEIGAPHFKGTLAAARQGQGNPNKQSSGSQFYLVQGTIQTDAALDGYEKRGGFKYNADQRAKYKTIGGTPALDNDYTVFGEVVEGLDIIDKIANVKTNEYDRPYEDITMNIRMGK